MDSQSKPHVLKEMPPPSPQKKKSPATGSPSTNQEEKNFDFVSST